MAEVTAFRNNALPYPIYGQQYTITYPMLDADGDLVTGATTPDAERSLNGDTFADCTNESTEIATNSGMYYLTLTAAEMTADIVTVIAKSATAGMKTTAITLYPRKLVTVRTGTCADDGSGTADVVLDSGSSAVDDYYNGCVVCVVIDGAASAECRVVTDYTGSTKTATVAVGFNTAVDNTDTFTMYIPEGALHGDMLYGDKIYSDTTHIDSDIASHFTVLNAIVSDIQSDTNVMVPVISDIQSDTNVLITRTLLIVSDTSDILSHLAAYDASAGLLSDINSGINALQVAIPAGEGDISDILSRLTVTNSQLVVVKSDAAHIESQATVIKSDVISNATRATTIASNVLIIKSDVSDVLSNLASGSGDISDIRSMLSDVNSGIDAVQAAGGALSSDQDSKLTAVATTVLVGGTLFELASDIYSDTTTIQSDTITLASDLAEADFSDLSSAIAALSASSLSSDQDSKLTAIATTVLVGGTLFELASDIYSDTTHIDSDVASNATRIQQIQSDVISNATVLAGVRSDTTTLASDLAEGDFSDILSRLTVTNANVLLILSDTSDVLSAVTIIKSDVISNATRATTIASNAVIIKSDTTAIQTKTDSLTFTNPNQVDANIQAVNDVTVSGTGALGDEWGP